MFTIVCDGHVSTVICDGHMSSVVCVMVMCPQCVMVKRQDACTDHEGIDATCNWNNCSLGDS